MWTELEKAIGYTYRDKELLKMALTHSSYANEMYKNNLLSYERLEFLGDSILGFVTAEYLYKTFPDKHEGELTRIRADLVCEKNLSEVATELHIGEHLMLGHGEKQGGGAARTSILCDVMESLIAAAFLDGGFEAAKFIVMRLILPKLSAVAKSRDYKTELQEYIQQKKDQVLSYELLGQSGPDHCKEFHSCVKLNGEQIGQGIGSSKKRAEQAAACDALKKMGL
ncbi:MAG: ribonuclease III [Ruminococcaceae bacterium]|nr:ribonuclease III [Oscillospiraceae bacterium]